MEEKSLKESLQEELDAVQSERILSSDYQRKKLIIWAVRTSLTLLIFYWFWETQWVRWAFCVYVPISLLGLVVIYLGPKMLQRKLEQTKERIDTMEDSSFIEFDELDEK